MSTKPQWVSLKSYTDEVTYNKIHRHLTDINDVISEDDIRNIKLYSPVIETETDRRENKL